MATQATERRQNPWPAWLTAIVGAWVLLSPFLLGFSGVTAGLWNNLLAGVLLAVFALWAHFGQRPQVYWADVVVGIWLVLSPFLLGFSGETTALWNNLITGVLGGAFGLWGALKQEG